MRELDTRLRGARKRAWSQAGLLTSDDLREFGLANRKAVQRLTERKLLVQARPGVWRLADALVTMRQQRMAACLWAGGGVLCGPTAMRIHELDRVDHEGKPLPAEPQAQTPVQHPLIGAQWQGDLFGDPAPNELCLTEPRAESDPWARFDPTDQSIIHVAVTKGALTRAPDSICVHRVKEFRKRAVVDLEGLRVTSVERTLLDCAAYLDEEALQWAVESAWHQEKLRPERFLRWLKTPTKRGTRGVAQLRRLLSGSIARQRPMESPLEVRTWRAIARARLPPPEVQVTLRNDRDERFRPDFLYRAEGLIIEALGYGPHSTRKAFDADADRVTRLTALGYSVLPVTWQMLKTNEAEVMARIAESLRVRRRGHEKHKSRRAQLPAPAVSE